MNSGGVHLPGSIIAHAQGEKEAGLLTPAKPNPIFVPHNILISAREKEHSIVVFVYMGTRASDILTAK
jgi:hypothetical protein